MRSWIVIILLGWSLPACGPVRTAGGAGPDYWGHRPGPRGFGTVIIDAGHGGHDDGARSAAGVREKDLALDTAYRLQRKLAGNARVVLLRKDDRFIDLDDRVAMASHRRGTVLLSIHYNSGSRTARGPETYYWRVDSHGMAYRIQRELEKVSPAESGNRGQVRRRLRLTRNTDIPSVLIECGYLSNPSEAMLCSSPGYREQLAGAIAKAIIDQQHKGDAGTGALPQPINAPPSKPGDRGEW